MKITSIAPAGKADVYNMQVGDTHNFAVNNGIIVHNCDEWRYACMSRPITPLRPVKQKQIFYDPLDQFKPKR